VPSSSALEIYAKSPPIPQLEYLYGMARLQQLDPKAGSYISHFIENFKGDNYIKDAYLKLGWAFLLNRDTAAFTNCRKLAIRYGASRFEEDKNALKEAKNTRQPDMHLLRARLLYDGGLYTRASAELTSVPITYFKNKDEKSESLYRLGRIQEGMGAENEALRYYSQVIKDYPNPRSYFAPAACLYCGMIYEKRNNIAMARQYYKSCLQYSDYPYHDSFNQKANAGLKRME
jgi:tetratricopeptide (TPR) repeat protein